jgi:dehydrodolichyl diphosphate syntase complex subunit NUS1
VKSLSRTPHHLSVILGLEDGERDGIGLEKIMNEVGEIAAWSSCVGIKTLSVYEKTGKQSHLAMPDINLLT